MRKTKNFLKKAFLLLALIGGASSAWASSVSDLKTIATDYVFIADDITSNGTAGLSSNTLYDGNVIFAPTENSVATNKGNSSIEEVNHLNSLRIKKTQDRLAFKVNGACTVTFYTQSHAERGLYVSKADNVSKDDDAFAKQPVSTPSWEVSLDAAGVYYLTSYSGDFYIAGFKIEYPKTGQPTISANPASAEYSQGDVATALSVSATAAGSGALSYQWYKNETNQSVLVDEGAEEIGSATNATYIPSTTTAGTTYYFCKVTEAGNANVATSRMAKVVVKPSGFDVAYSLGDVTGTVGTLPADESAVTSVTIPVNKTLYKNGYTLTAWNDGSADHAIGEVVEITANTTFTPVFTANGASSYLGHNLSTVTWGFQTSNGDPTWELEGLGVETKGYYVAQTSVGGSNIDLLMIMDATNGKINNKSNDTWAQMNDNTVLTIPVVVGAEVAVKVYSEGTTPLSFGGNNGTYDSGVYSYTATADGDLDITIADQGYVQYVEVSYPSESAVLTVSAVNTKVGLTQDIINSVDYLTASTDNWSNSQTMGDYTGEFYNMSSTDRNITIKVTGASRFEVYVKNNTADRTYKVKVGSADAQTITHKGTGVESSGVFAIANPAEETTITISGNGASVYPGYFVFDPAVSGTITDCGWSSYASNRPLDLSTISGGTAYYASAASESTVTLTPTGDVTVPAGEGIMIKGTAGETFTINVAASGTAIEGNLLKGQTTTGNVAASTAGTYHYVFGYESSSVYGFYNLASDANVPAGKAYLETTNQLQAQTAPAAIRIVDEESGATNIEAIDSTEEAVKFIENGKLYIKKNNVVYDMMGTVVR